MDEDYEAQSHNLTTAYWIRQHEEFLDSNLKKNIVETLKSGRQKYKCLWVRSQLEKSMSLMKVEYLRFEESLKRDREILTSHFSSKFESILCKQQQFDLATPSDFAEVIALLFSGIDVESSPDIDRAYEGFLEEVKGGFKEIEPWHARCEPTEAEFSDWPVTGDELELFPDLGEICEELLRSFENGSYLAYSYKVKETEDVIPEQRTVILRLHVHGMMTTSAKAQAFATINDFMPTLIDIVRRSYPYSEHAYEHLESKQIHDTLAKIDGTLPESEYEERSNIHMTAKIKTISDGLQLFVDRRPEKSKTEMERRLRRAVEFARLAFTQSDIAVKAVLACAGMEALLSSKGRDIAETLAGRYSVMLCPETRGRIEVIRSVKKFYDLRSNFVHGTSHAVDSELAKRAMNFLAIGLRSIFEWRRRRILDGLDQNDYESLEKNLYSAEKEAGPVVGFPDSLRSLPQVSIALGE